MVYRLRLTAAAARYCAHCNCPDSFTPIQGLVCCYLDLSSLPGTRTQLTIQSSCSLSQAHPPLPRFRCRPEKARPSSAASPRPASRRGMARWRTSSRWPATAGMWQLALAATLLALAPLRSTGAQPTPAPPPDANATLHAAPQNEVEVFISQVRHPGGGGGHGSPRIRGTPGTSCPDAAHCWQRRTHTHATVVTEQLPVEQTAHSTHTTHTAYTRTRTLTHARRTAARARARPASAPRSRDPSCPHPSPPSHTQAHTHNTLLTHTRRTAARARAPPASAPRSQTRSCPRPTPPN